MRCRNAAQDGLDREHGLGQNSTSGHGVAVSPGVAETDTLLKLMWSVNLEQDGTTRASTEICARQRLESDHGYR